MLHALCLIALASMQGESSQDLLTVAEMSDFRATSTSEQVLGLLTRIQDRSPVMSVSELARSTQGKPVSLVVLANPPVDGPAAARDTGKPVVLICGNIHAGEVCGKEALLMLIRELATTPDHPLLDELILLVVPNFNPDGNDEMDPGNRPGQVGPAEGMGQRANGQGLDLNRDWMKLEAPETRGFVRVLSEWDPHLVIDTHTTNGSQHRYALTYSAPTNPAGFSPSIEFVRDDLLPTVGEQLLARTGYDTCFYGNFNRDHTVWATYSSDPRHGGPYCGLRGQMAILSEAYAHIPFEDRVLATREFLREIIRHVIEHKTHVLELHTRARTEVSQAGANPQPSDVVGVRHRIAAFSRPITQKGFALESDPQGRLRPTAEHADHTVLHLGRFEATESVRRPFAYLVEPGLDGVVEKLRQHGIAVDSFAGAARVESYRITKIGQARRAYQGHQRLDLEVEATDAELKCAEGTMLVRLSQPLGNLIVNLLEPRAVDGLAAWNYLDERLAEGAAFPIHRVRSPGDLN